MIPETLKSFSSKTISNLLLNNHSELLKDFYDMQSEFLISRYKINKSIEISNILTLLSKSLHLAIVRQREINMNHDISLKNFFSNQNNIINHGYKIVSIVNTTGIPKETVRRKLKKLIERREVNFNNKTKLYYWILKEKNKNLYLDFIDRDIEAISRFVNSIADKLNLNLKNKFIQEEIKSQFSFYYYHYYSCQLEWMKMWQTNIKDIDLIFIAIQALIPVLDYKKKNIDKISMENLHLQIGKTNSSTDQITNKNAISANSISQISGIPRATCVRKLEKLVNLGMLMREIKSRKYYVNPNPTDRSKHITKKENIDRTVEIFSDFLSIVISSMSRNVDSYMLKNK